MYCFVLGIAESKICIEQQIMFLCDCKCAVHLTQLSISYLTASTGSVVEWRTLFNGCRAFRRARMLTLNIDLFDLKIFAILGLIIFTTIAIIKNAKTFHFSSRPGPGHFAPLFTTPPEGCYWRQGFKEQNTMKSNTFASPHGSAKAHARARARGHTLRIGRASHRSFSK